eukprot:TRINITY_DN204_c0_g1_i1.p1 TRINITY_DN204_c0_g1~~TRINITY_DN204_c0_g1_i1.p1  ORF type:complete len:543 (-),score=170.55 TRINITY_DN204_c0_g1_i1:195-1823(-)
MSETEVKPEVPVGEEATGGEEQKMSKKQLKKLEKKAEKEKRKREAEAAAALELEKLFRVLSIEEVGKVPFGKLPLIQSRKHSEETYTQIEALDTELAGKKVVLRARIHSSRSKGKLCFVVLRHQMFTVQAMLCVSETVPKDMIRFAAGLPKESIVDVYGEVSPVETKIESCTQKNVEINVERFYCVSASAPVLPFQIDDAGRRVAEEDDASVIRVGQDVRLDHRIIDLRVPTNCAIFRIRSGVACLFREFFNKINFVEIHTPKLIGAASEGGANVFRVDYFDRHAYLAQSPQLYKEMAVMGDFGGVFEIGPVFRAEQSHTHRHLTEFVGLDMEMPIIDHYGEVLDVLDDMMEYIVDGLNTRYKKELDVVREQFPFEPLEYNKPTLRLSFPEGVKLLREAGIEQGELDDLSTANEKLLGKIVKEKYHTDFYMMDRYPSSIRPFYTMPCADDPRYSNSYDLFLRGEEICSGAQRIHDPELLLQRGRDLNVDMTPLQSYVDSFRYGAWPHGGAGLGLDRIAMLFLGLDNVRKTSLFPRDPSRLSP